MEPWLLTSKDILYFPPVFAIQGLAICTAYLIWVFSKKRMPIISLILFGFFLQCLKVIAGCISHFLEYPALHWIQTIEILLAGFFILLTPLLGMIFFYRKAKVLVQEKQNNNV
jgi:hypothetical protein